jgi:hypothetical protein
MVILYILRVCNLFSISVCFPNLITPQQFEDTRHPRFPYGKDTEKAPKKLQNLCEHYLTDTRTRLTWKIRSTNSLPNIPCLA